MSGLLIWLLRKASKQIKVCFVQNADKKINNRDIIEIPKEILERAARATENILPRKLNGL